MRNKDNQNKAREPVNLDVRIERPIIHTVSRDFEAVTADRKSLLYVYNPIRILEVQCLVEGAGASAVINLQYSNDTTVFTSLFNADETISSVTTTVYLYPHVNDVPGGHWLWLNVASVGGTVDHLHLTVIYEQ